MKLIVVLLAFVVAGCGTPTPEGATTSTSQPAPTSTTTIGTSNDSGRVKLAIADLAARLDIDPAAIEVLIDEEVTWNDGSLGCPAPDMAYTQALVDGYRIVLLADGERYRYHGSLQAEPFLCERLGL